jgi:hypothetical protein
MKTKQYQEVTCRAGIKLDEKLERSLKEDAATAASASASSPPSRLILVGAGAATNRTGNDDDDQDDVDEDDDEATAEKHRHQQQMTPNQAPGAVISSDKAAVAKKGKKSWRKPEVRLRRRG